jgi:hypothetical protein
VEHARNAKVTIVVMKSIVLSGEEEESHGEV